MKLKYILALADCIRLAARAGHPFSPEQITHLADFCARHHQKFDKALWLQHIIRE